MVKWTVLKFRSSTLYTMC
uniref:Uncharacterized protein n=1 Tax=Anguilla anguilla TaxID=7936 RepID=A0A0E9UL03_ANGAN